MSIGGFKTTIDLVTKRRNPFQGGRRGKEEGGGIALIKFRIRH
jgi:hypothetical protein